MKNSKWSTKSTYSSTVHVVLFVSRNKDNFNFPEFKERRKAFITELPADSEILQHEFEAFVNAGEVGERSRMYYSVNARDMKKTYTDLLHFLIDNPGFNLCSIQSKLAGIAMKKENATEEKWMYDFDIDSDEDGKKFALDILRAAKLDSEEPIEVEVHRTPGGYHFICSRPFDSREIYSRWDTNLITLMRDGMYLYSWKNREE